MSEHHHHDHCHNGAAGHDSIFGSKTELQFSILAGSFLLVGFLLSFIPGVSTWVPLIIYVASFFFGGFYALKEAAGSLVKGRFDIDFLMIAAALGAASLGEWAEGALLLFLFSLGHALEHSAMDKARKSISALSDLSPKTAFVKRAEGVEEILIEELRIDDIVIVKPDSKIPADGVVVKGSGAVNQSPITGESIPVDKVPLDSTGVNHIDINDVNAENRVFAGTINGSAELHIRVLKLSADSTLSRLIKLVSDTKAKKSRTQRFTDEVQIHYVPGVLALVAILLCAFLFIDESFSESFYRAMAVLVAASPCALAISTPSAVLSGIARGARGGVLFKGGGPLEELGGLRAIAFDKTGTLTEGKPRLTSVTALNESSEDEVLLLAAAVERHSNHPIAAAIVRAADERTDRPLTRVSEVTSVQGHGLSALVDGSRVLIGNISFFDDLSEDVRKLALGKESEGNTTILIKKDDHPIGIITVMDTPRPEAAETISRLRKLGIKRMVMLSGDNQQVADSVAGQIGMSEAWGGLLPEQKLDSIAALLKREEHVAMVGDGVNDAPAMAKSSVGIAMGAAGSDVALETADVALMSDKLSSLPFAIGLSRQSHRVIKQNLWISLGMVAILVPLTILDVASIGFAVVGHEGSTLLVVFNALRLLNYQYKA
ncbi:Cd2+/Zn2+-exporting ATPase [Arcticibacter pallidicorallinus]|uniref:P-type Zn(2+) transporter n=1 Tax=Arcticibacter pallidicorallinus TaxID=1259464 RepID=A0A2T0U511_9SPHI|nr:heavy metal translocating P-type ATPase [Arcticibacter pallidicorallinus]PRY53015.1 Cd2+/Zn2+-exporting ATPase [Arcticibacter pallidicorallinus]